MPVKTKAKPTAKKAAPKARKQAAPEGAFSTTAFEARGDVYESMKQAADRSSAARGGGGGNFLKLDQKVNTVRIAQDPDDRSKPWVLFFRQHRGQTADGKFTSMLDLGWLLQGDRGYGGLADALSTEDRELVAEWGDPVAKIAQAVRDAVGGKLDDLPKDLRDAKYRPWSEGRGLFTAIKDGAVGVLETSPTLHDQILALFHASPAAFSTIKGYDLQIGTNGKTGLGKRYLAPSIVLGSQGDAEYQGQFPDLVKVVKKRVVGWKAKAAFAILNYPKFMSFADITKADLGIKGK